MKNLIIFRIIPLILIASLIGGAIKLAIYQTRDVVTPQQLDKKLDEIILKLESK